MDLGRNGTWQSGLGNLDPHIVGQPRILRVQDFVCFFPGSSLLKRELGRLFLKPYYRTQSCSLGLNEHDG